MNNKFIPQIKKMTLQNAIHWSSVEGLSRTYESVSDGVSLRCCCLKPNISYKLTINGIPVDADTVTIDSLCKVIEDQVSQTPDINLLFQKFIDGVQ